MLLGATPLSLLDREEVVGVLWLRLVVTEVGDELPPKLLKQQMDLGWRPESHTLATFLKVTKKTRQSRASEALYNIMRAL